MEANATHVSCEIWLTEPLRSGQGSIACRTGRQAPKLRVSLQGIMIYGNRRDGERPTQILLPDQLSGSARRFWLIPICSSTASSASQEALGDDITEEYKHSIAGSGMNGPEALEYDHKETGCHGDTHPPSRLPILRSPIDRSDGPWLTEGHIASPWLSLFYGESSSSLTSSRAHQMFADLAMVAVLTVFSTTHELATPASIPTFLS